MFKVGDIVEYNANVGSVFAVIDSIDHSHKLVGVLKLAYVTETGWVAIKEYKYTRGSLSLFKHATPFQIARLRKMGCV